MHEPHYVKYTVTIVIIVEKISLQLKVGRTIGIATMRHQGTCKPNLDLAWIENLWLLNLFFVCP